MNTITDFINRDFRPIDSKDTIAEVLDFFADVNFSHFPVTEEGIYIGSVSAEDVETFEPEKTLANYRYAIEVFFARTTTNWFDVLEVFARNHTDVVPVLDAENKYAGYYEISDIVKFFNDTPFLKDPGGIIVVEKGILDYSMGQVVQIVESNNAKILGTFVSGSTNDTIQITVKIAMGSINEIIQTFRRYDYEIISEHNEDNYLNSLKERSDYLDKYLNI
ncbi:CBS domain-containing protein [Flavobacterium pallidum]|uniref:Acetoin utilization protein acuB n=1 Tax=Flavobacterium pallidum TaxID=2172098 RepID=A0A2S1SE97_9FLAO|nr:CBS domain-containing protein [Flavobacterium pallidum]AWI24726.1 acetoin utilization protein acuB [Flavobacterium pallidum]